MSTLVLQIFNWWTVIDKDMNDFKYISKYTQVLLQETYEKKLSTRYSQILRHLPWGLFKKYVFFFLQRESK